MKKVPVIVLGKTYREAQSFVNEHLDSRFRPIIVTNKYKAEGYGPLLVVETLYAKENKEYNEIKNILSLGNAKPCNKDWPFIDSNTGGAFFNFINDGNKA